MEETRLRASALVCKAFLQYLAPLSEHSNKLIETFLKIVDLMERFMRTGSRQQVRCGHFDHFRCATPELISRYLSPIVRGRAGIVKECCFGYAFGWDAYPPWRGRAAIGRTG
jgi:hypothetical protein